MVISRGDQEEGHLSAYGLAVYVVGRRAAALACGLLCLLRVLHVAAFAAIGPSGCGLGLPACLRLVASIVPRREAETTPRQACGPPSHIRRAAGRS